MTTSLERRSEFFLPKGREVSREALKKHHLLVFVSFLTSLLAFGFFFVSLAVGFPTGYYTMAASSVVFASLPFFVKAGASRNLVANVYVGIIFLDTILITGLSGGLSASITSAYIAIIPMLAVMLIGQKAGFVWFLVVIAEVLALGVLQVLGVEFPFTFDPRFDAAFKLAAFLGLVVIVYVIVRDFDSATRRAQRQVEEEQEKTESLLLNILPAEVAEELKATGRARARQFDEATILLSDFRNFTEISSQMTPSELVEELNTCFYAFDRIMRAHELEKIKTIGDAYMAASGLTLAESPSPVRIVEAALEMQRFMADHSQECSDLDKPAFEMRVGVHTGPVVAGVVGDTKFQYDVWGDAVNTASRMESSGEPGEVNISGATYDLVKDTPGLVFTHRGRIQVKGKGELDMYFVRKSTA
jgi:class 3 adenylate cyclase